MMIAKLRCPSVAWVFLVACALSVVGLGSARAQSIDQQCLVSFDVQERIFSMHGMSVSCRDIEFIRRGVFESLHRLGPDPGTGGIAERVSDLETARDAARGEFRSRTHKILGVLIGNVSALVGLSSCVPTAGAGCLFAALGAVSSRMEIGDSSINLARAHKSLSGLEAELDIAQKQLEGRVRAFEAARSVLVSDFNQLCSQVRKQCL